MTKRRVLVQWIGHSDLRAMATALPQAQNDEIMRVVKGEVPKAGDVGPIKTLLNTQEFNEIRLLSNYPANWNKWFVKWLGVKSDVVATDLLHVATTERTHAAVFAEEMVRDLA